MALDRTPTDRERWQLSAFCRFFDELWSNWEELRANGIELSASFELKSDGRVSGGSLGISRHRLKGFLVDYRHFSGADEPTYFFKIVKLIKAVSWNEEVHRLLDGYKKRWAETSGLSGWHNSFSADDVVNAVFNEGIFHAEPLSKKQVRMQEIAEKLTDDAMWWELTFVVFQRMVLILQIKTMISGIVAGTNTIAVPTSVLDVVRR